jgi:hypothetical protein
MTPSPSTTPQQQTEMIEKVLHDPLLLRRLSDRIYQLLLDDVLMQRDRTHHP